MLENTPSIRHFVKVTSQILLAVMSCALVFLMIKFTILSFILSLTDMSEIHTHAVKGLASLISFSLGYLIYVKYYEKRKTVELALSGPNILYGTMFGTVIISSTILSLFALGYYQIELFQSSDEVLSALIGLSTQAIVGTIIFTGVFFRLIELQIGTKYSLLSLSILLGLLNIMVDGANLLVLLSTFLINALWFSLYVLSRNLWVVGLTTGAWLSTVFAVGILDEHWRASAPIISNFHGPVFLTGGDFGPEHSVITIVVVSICLFFILHLAKDKELFISV
jgi:hypothetical protein